MFIRGKDGILSMNKSVCFVMTYHGRPEITRMSLYHMAWVVGRFKEQGVDAVGLVIGDDANQAKYCEGLGLKHEYFPNFPLADKYNYMWLRAVQHRKTYICKLDSNNVHSFSYWDKCVEWVKGHKRAIFGGRRCIIANSDLHYPETCLFNAYDYYLLGTGIFYLTYTFENSVNLFKMYTPDHYCNFDGVIIDAFMNWAVKKEHLEVVSDEEDDCIDLKSKVDIHSYQSYIEKPHYPRSFSIEELRGRHPHLDMYFKGGFASS